MKQVKCECGHVNPHGTILCESCGKPVEDVSSKNLLDMRYEGSARRSQTYNKTIIDKIWNFFSSVKVGVWLIVITLIASALGTIYPQEMYIPPTVSASEHYANEYGWTGQLYYELGFHDLYGSWWYMILIASIGISLVICSLDRVIPLHRALKQQNPKKHPNFLKRQRLVSITKDWTEDDYNKVKAALKKRRYHIFEENGNILAEKGRFSRWGPYVNHIGLIIFLIGAMLRFVPGLYVDEVLWLREGETKVVPGTDGQYYLKNDRFAVEMYNKNESKDVFQDAIDRVGDGSVVKNYQADVTLYERKGEIVHGAEPELEKIKDYEIRVNQPLKHEKYALYQVDYKLNEFSAMSFNLVNKESNESFGSLKVDLHNPQKNYDLGNGYRVELASYFPDFYFDSDGNPNTKTRIPNNPAFVFKMVSPTKPEGEVAFVAIRENLEPLGDNEYKMAFAGVETKNVTGLTVRKDLTLWILGVGGAIFMIGVIQGMYWNHRRLWIQRIDNEIWLAGHTNKNWYGLRNELNKALSDTSFVELEDQVQQEKEHVKEV
ncbi:cytochrome c biogenesis protein ResB [Metabacillus iocasae]|uniref:Cytochrome c biogenesis protein n=1 Tax=Priestia iocasae TaxID=2291674 RepID=A0ABS2QQF4_9BACI|nr:cytochrome c biogenesis protein ResB [Metabacillus iocasae]MBM7701679.1 cytochrome c biogenesis protein [Metabacillus iocasae]